MKPSAILLIILVGACSRPSEERSVDLTVPVSVRPAGTGTIEALLSATGTLRPIQEAELITEIRGDLHFGRNGDSVLREGAAVQKDQVVARLTNAEWVVNAKVESRRLALETATRTLKEKQALADRRLVSENEAHTARKALADAQSSYEDAQIQIEKTYLRSPIDGVLTDWTTVTEATRVNANTPIGRVVNYDSVLVDLQLPNSAILSVREGTRLRVTNYAFADSAFAGLISSVDPVLDATTRTYRAVGTVANPSRLLRPGMFVRADVVTTSREGVILIPKELILVRRNRKVVFVEEDGRATMQDVVTGLENRDVVEILSGLEEGDRLITSNYETLRPRTRVRVTTEETAR